MTQSWKFKWFMDSLWSQLEVKDSDFSIYWIIDWALVSAKHINSFSVWNLGVCFGFFWFILVLRERQRERAHLGFVVRDLVNQMSRTQNSSMLFAFWIWIKHYALFLVTQIAVQEKRSQLLLERVGWICYISHLFFWISQLQPWWLFLFLVILRIKCSDTNYNNSHFCGF